MADNRDTLFRQWTMLRLIPRHPRVASTREVHQALESEGFDTTPRTVERDLDKLSSIFGYTSDTAGRTNHWFWPGDFKSIDIPGLEPNTALAFNLAEQHLAELLPPSTLQLLAPYFARARDILQSDSARRLHDWTDKIRVLGTGPQLAAAEIDVDIQRAMYDALLHERRVEITYSPRHGGETKTYHFSPLGLVSREGVIYLVGPLWNYANVVQLALQRVRTLTPLGTDCHWPEGFDLDDYIGSEQGFSYPTGEGRIELVLEMDNDAALHLAERPLSTDQRITPAEEDRSRVSASVVDTDALTWWVLGFGSAVEVVQPKELRQRVGEAHTDAAAQYA
ncbi:helix-turn-helix transcriptional regulator [Salinisphaera orenii]|uniref:Transcriptional regulator n=1 Tax=Salinisphaera orenii YIM 95161 TaxID=1051139 RepID=A0A423PDQ5_9GAMM|nr:WYL domain-containing protein [Salinisphaera halophila]ROO23727.1 transcriptional regulator [Salinisphaera halophila YIM 95161]